MASGPEICKQELKQSFRSASCKVFLCLPIKIVLPHHEKQGAARWELHHSPPSSGCRLLAQQAGLGGSEAWSQHGGGFPVFLRTRGSRCLCWDPWVLVLGLGQRPGFQRAAGLGGSQAGKAGERCGCGGETQKGRRPSAGVGGMRTPSPTRLPNASAAGRCWSLTQTCPAEPSLHPTPPRRDPPASLRREVTSQPWLCHR